MAKSSALTSIEIYIVPLLAILVCSEADNRREYCCRQKETKMTVYLQQILGGPNANLVAVAGIPGRPRSPFEFGTVIIADNPLTQGISMNSPTVGRGQGILVTSSLDGANKHGLFSYVFTNGQYNGSTLEFQGRYDQNATVTELSLVSGTKMFRYVHGYVTFQVVLERSARNYGVIKSDIVIRQS